MNIPLPSSSSSHRIKMIFFRYFKIIDVVVKQRRISWILVSIMCSTVVWSWTSQRIIFVPLAARSYTNSKYRHDRQQIKISGLSNYLIQTRPASAAASFSRSRSSLLFSDQQVSDPLAINDSELIQTLIQAKTTLEIDLTLRRALYDECVDVDDEEVNLMGIPFSRLSLNATAATLRRMAHISVLEARTELAKNNRRGTILNTSNNSNVNTDTAVSENSVRLQKKIISNLLEAVGIKLMSHRSALSPSSKSSTSTITQIQKEQELPGVFPLSDVLQALAVLAPKGKMRPFAILVVEFLNMHDTSELYKLRPIRLVQCLQAMAKLDIDHTVLQSNIISRLLKPDAVSTIPARFLAHGLWALASFQSTKRKAKAATKSSNEKKFRRDYSIEDDEGDDTVNNNNDTMRLSRAFMRRLRKQKVAQEASVEDMCRGLAATRDLLNLGAMTNMEDEAAIFGFTCLRTILERKNSTSPSLLMNPTQMTDMISSWATLSDQNREDTVIADLLQICIDDDTIKECNIGQLELIIRSIRKLNVRNHAEVTKSVGERFLNVVEENQYSNFENVYPRSTNEILRWPALVHRKNKSVMEPFINTASLLFTKRSFLERSTVEEIANFLWFLSITRNFDENILSNIGECLLKPEMVDACSPKMASRILATFTSLVVLNEESSSESLTDLKQDLFYSYGGLLLSQSLSPAEISSSLYAYAKANYVQDMGVFDHLVKLLASSMHICSPRQLSQTLWSCGKMIKWERQERLLPEEQNIKKEDPPYLDDALTIMKELSSRVEDLSPADVAQIIWAMGRLEIQDDKLMSIFANRVVDICSSMNSAEVSNVLWGIVRVRYKDRILIESLSDRLTTKDIRISPQEAASVLFSMGKLSWKDEHLFGKLSTIMIDQIQDVNAQSIANTLWAFQAIRIRAPRELLNIWAITRLGLKPASLKQIAEEEE
ncbi:MAG: hypothetical protein ACI90V_002788 [Bacillariaceae sp.]|jgi:hypothetical protein